MYYETKLINGVLCCRTTPEGEWQRMTYPTPFQVAEAALAECDEEDRHKLFSAYCTSCGSGDPRCHCSNDE
jgi:hypothetical protein